MKTLALLLALCLPLAAADLYVTTFEAEANPTVYTNFADSTDQACSGSESAKTTSPSGNMEMDFTEVDPVWFGIYIYPTSLPSATTLLALSQTLANAESCRFEIFSDGRVQARTTGDAYEVSASPAIQAGVWQLVEFRCDNTGGAGADIAEIRVNETVVVTKTDGSGAVVTGTARFFEISDPTAATYYDDFYASDSGYRGFSAGCGDPTAGAAKRKAMVVGD